MTENKLNVPMALWWLGAVALLIMAMGIETGTETHEAKLNREKDNERSR